MNSFSLFRGLLLVGLAVTLAACTAPVTPIFTLPPAPPVILAPASQAPPSEALPTFPARDISPRTPAAPSSPSPSLPPARPAAAIELGQPYPLTRGELQDAVFTSDGKLLVASTSGIYIHAAETLAFQGELIKDRRATHLASSPDGSALVMGGPGGVQFVTQTINLAPLQPVGFATNSRDLDFTADGRLALLDNAGSTVTFWNPGTGLSTQQTFPLDDASRSMAFSPDGHTLALGGDNGRLELFDLQRSTRLIVISEGDGRALADLSFSPDGAYLAGARVSADGVVQVWSVGARKRLVEQYSLGYFSRHPFVAFSSGGKRLLAGNGDLAMLWERPVKQPVATLSGYSSSIWDLAVSPQGDRLAYSTFHWPVFVLDLPGAGLASGTLGAKAPRVFSLPGHEAFGVAFSPDGATLAAGLYNYSGPEAQPPLERVHLWDIGSGENSSDFPGVTAAAFHPDGQSLALASSDGSLWVTGRDGQGDRCLPGCDCWPTAGEAQTSTTWTAIGACVVRLPQDLSPMRLAYSPSGDLLAVTGIANGWSAAAVWDPDRSGSPWAWFPGGSRPSLGAFHIGAGGIARLRWVALGIDELNADHGLAARWLVVHELLAQRDVLRVAVPGAAMAAFSPDGALLAVGLSSHEQDNPTGQDPPDPAANGLQLWDVATWQPIATQPLPYGVTHLAFTPDGRSLITATGTGQILLWELVRP